MCVCAFSAAQRRLYEPDRAVLVAWSIAVLLPLWSFEYFALLASENCVTWCCCCGLMAVVGMAARGVCGTFSNPRRLCTNAARQRCRT